LNAKSITYLPVPGVPQLMERLGLKDAIASKVTVPKIDISCELVAKGEIELGIVAITQTFTTPDVALAGPLPEEIQMYTDFGCYQCGLENLRCRTRFAYVPKKSNGNSRHQGTRNGANLKAIE
jgi:hypothetical protein